MPKISVKCQQCSTVIIRWPSQIKASKYGPFCSNKCIGLFRTEKLVGDLAANWKSGFNKDRKYIRVIAKWHPACDIGGAYSLHRLIAEAKLGRFLKDEEIVHHIDGDQLNNHWDNLEVTTQSNHAKEHYYADRKICKKTGRLK